MLRDLFKPINIKNKMQVFNIGYQKIIVIEYNLFKDSIIIDSVLKKIMLLNVEIYFFTSLDEMEEELELLVSYTKDDYIVIIN